jgi:hypothetical protein
VQGYSDKNRRDDNHQRCDDDLHDHNSFND